MSIDISFTQATMKGDDVMLAISFSNISLFFGIGCSVFHVDGWHSWVSTREMMFYFAGIKEGMSVS